MKKTFESFIKSINEAILQFPLSRNNKFGGEGTHVICLPSENYPEKYWNKITYVSVDVNGQYRLHAMSGSNKERLSKFGKYWSIFFSPAIPNKHFEWIPNSIIYDSIGNEVGNIDETIIASEKYNL